MSHNLPRTLSELKKSPYHQRSLGQYILMDYMRKKKQRVH
jgi:hypothetical protein